MKTRRFPRAALAAALLLCTLLPCAFPALSPALAGEARYGSDSGRILRGDDEAPLVLHGGRRPTFKASAGVDTFCLYGGPGSTLGKFQDDLGDPGLQGWTGVDVTEVAPQWQVSAFNAGNLGGKGPGNRAMWCGLDAAQRPGWASAPGYGNDWNAQLEFRARVSDPDQGAAVALDFFFNHDSEPGYDFFEVEYETASQTHTILSISGTNEEAGTSFPEPGVRFSDVGGTITYDANDYVAKAGDEIVLRMVGRSDGSFSDEDGLFSTLGGLAQVDDIVVDTGEATFFEDFEGGPPYLWRAIRAPYAGDFARAFGQLQDIDPCVDNPTTVLCFVDDGTGPFNPSYNGPGTGGVTSMNWSYGVPGGWVVNYDGGVSGGTVPLNNEVWSPAIDWDLPGAADDHPLVAGSFVRFSVWRHLPIPNGIFYRWAVRTSADGSNAWGPWRDRGIAYFGGSGEWAQRQIFVSDLIGGAPDRVQLKLGVQDLASVFAFPGTDATPSPCFDNVGLFKFAVKGPVITARFADLFQDSFPQSGLIEAGTLEDRSLLDVRVDMAQDVSTGANIVAGDSLVFDVQSVVPGVGITDPGTQIRMFFSLNINPFFEATLRPNVDPNDPAGGIFGWDQAEGFVGAQPVTVGSTPIPNRYFFDLPDQDWMYPGDLLQYYIEAFDDQGNRSTFPPDLTGYDMWPTGQKVSDVCDGFSQNFHETVPFNEGPYGGTQATTGSGLPTIWDDFRAKPNGTDERSAGKQIPWSTPRILVINDFAFSGGQEEYHQVFYENGLYRFGQWDMYNVMAPSMPISNGIGSAGAHGASVAQLAQYDCILYVSGNLTNTLSDGSNRGGNDKSDDIGLLTGWHDVTGNRSAAYFGDNIASSLHRSPAGQTYLSSILGVDFGDDDVRDDIANQTVPRVLPTGAIAAFSTTYLVNGGCPDLNRFDRIQPLPGAVTSHGFQDVTGGIFPGSSAGVVFDRGQGGDRLVDVTFPYGLIYVQNETTKGAPSKRSQLVGELLAFFGHTSTNPPVPAPVLPPFAVDPIYPNPFNAATNVSFETPAKGRVTARIYDLRGALVRTLFDDEVPGGRHTVTWLGLDDRGAAVASGVYLVRVEGFGRVDTQKVALVK